MFNILIWGTGYGYSKYINVLKYQELLGEIKIIGITGKDEIYLCLDGYQFFPLSEIKKLNIDYIVITSGIYFNEIIMEAKSLGILKPIFIMAKVFEFPGFLFSKYIYLLNSRVSIISNNCWGGTAYHSLGMKFYSPFINMFETDRDYLRLLYNLRYYMKLKLEFIDYGYNSILNINYPICKLGDVILHFNHYSDVEIVKIKWYERVKRITWDNLFIMMFTEDEQIANEFDKLNYKKKICFVPFSSTLSSSYYLQIRNKDIMKKIPFWSIVNKMASGHYHDYDLIDLLHTGKINKNRYFCW